LHAPISDPDRQNLADLLTRAAADVLGDFEHELRLSDSPLVKDDAARERCLAQASRVLVDTAAHIRTGQPATGCFDLPGEIGARLAAAGIQLSSSLDAANVLFAATVRRVCAHLTGPDRTGPEAAEQISLAALALQAALVHTLRPAADSYTGVLHDRMRQARVDERRRLSRDLHDRIGQGISVAQRNLELHDIYRTADPTRAAARVRLAQDLLDDTICRVRQMIGDLRLVEPLERLTEATTVFLRLAGGPDLDSRVEVDGDEARVPDDVAEETFLIVREALRNVIAHADARRVRVRVDITPDRLRILVADDGRGFDPGDRRRDGTGMLSMHERAAMLGGTLTVASRAGEGTEVQLCVPLGGHPDRSHGR
jgi:signal transduction histidine kinase